MPYLPHDTIDRRLALNEGRDSRSADRSLRLRDELCAESDWKELMHAVSGRVSFPTIGFGHFSTSINTPPHLGVEVNPCHHCISYLAHRRESISCIG